MKQYIITNYEVKAKNKRIKVSLIYSEKEDKHFIKVETKTLINFIKREISSTSNIYSIETFLIIMDLFQDIYSSNKNKYLLKEIRDLSKAELTRISFKHPKFD